MQKNKDNPSVNFSSVAHARGDDRGSLSFSQSSHTASLSSLPFVNHPPLSTSYSPMLPPISLSVTVLSSYIRSTFLFETQDISVAPQCVSCSSLCLALALLCGGDETLTVLERALTLFVETSRPHDVSGLSVVGVTSGARLAMLQTPSHHTSLSIFKHREEEEIGSRGGIGVSDGVYFLDRMRMVNLRRNEERKRQKEKKNEDDRSFSSSVESQGTIGSKDSRSRSVKKKEEKRRQEIALKEAKEEENRRMLAKANRERDYLCIWEIGIHLARFLCLPSSPLFQTCPILTSLCQCIIQESARMLVDCIRTGDGIIAKEWTSVWQRQIERKGKAPLSSFDSFVKDSSSASQYLREVCDPTLPGNPMLLLLSYYDSLALSDMPECVRSCIGGVSMNHRNSYCGWGSKIGDSGLVSDSSDLEDEYWAQKLNISIHSERVQRLKEMEQSRNDERKKSLENPSNMKESADASSDQSIATKEDTVIYKEDLDGSIPEDDHVSQCKESEHGSSIKTRRDDDSSLIVIPDLTPLSLDDALSKCGVEASPCSSLPIGSISCPIMRSLFCLFPLLSILPISSISSFAHTTAIPGGLGTPKGSSSASGCLFPSLSNALAGPFFDSSGLCSIGECVWSGELATASQSGMNGLQGLSTAGDKGCNPTEMSNPMHARLGQSIASVSHSFFSSDVRGFGLLLSRLLSASSPLFSACVTFLFSCVSQASQDAHKSLSLVSFVFDSLTVCLNECLAALCISSTTSTVTSHDNLRVLLEIIDLVLSAFSDVSLCSLSSVLSPSHASASVDKFIHVFSGLHKSLLKMEGALAVCMGLEAERNRTERARSRFLWIRSVISGDLKRRNGSSSQHSVVYPSTFHSIPTLSLLCLKQCNRIKLSRGYVGCWRGLKTPLERGIFTHSEENIDDYEEEIHQKPSINSLRERIKQIKRRRKGIVSDDVLYSSDSSTAEGSPSCLPESFLHILSENLDYIIDESVSVHLKRNRTEAFGDGIKWMKDGLRWYLTSLVCSSEEEYLLKSPCNLRLSSNSAQFPSCLDGIDILNMIVESDEHSLQTSVQKYLRTEQRREQLIGSVLMIVLSESLKVCIRKGVVMIPLTSLSICVGFLEHSHTASQHIDLHELVGHVKNTSEIEQAMLGVKDRYCPIPLFNMDSVEMMCICMNIASICIGAPLPFNFTEKKTCSNYDNTIWKLIANVSSEQPHVGSSSTIRSGFPSPFSTFPSLSSLSHAIALCLQFVTLPNPPSLRLQHFIMQHRAILAVYQCLSGRSVLYLESCVVGLIARTMHMMLPLCKKLTLAYTKHVLQCTAQHFARSTLACNVLRDYYLQAFQQHPDFLLLFASQVMSIMGISSTTNCTRWLQDNSIGRVKNRIENVEIMVNILLIACAYSNIVFENQRVIDLLPPSLVSFLVVSLSSSSDPQASGLLLSVSSAVDKMKKSWLPSLLCLSHSEDAIVGMSSKQLLRKDRRIKVVSRILKLSPASSVKILMKDSFSTISAIFRTADKYFDLIGDCTHEMGEYEGSLSLLIDLLTCFSNLSLSGLRLLLIDFALVKREKEGEKMHENVRILESIVREDEKRLEEIEDDIRQKLISHIEMKHRKEEEDKDKDTNNEGVSSSPSTAGDNTVSASLSRSSSIVSNSDIEKKVRTIMKKYEPALQASKKLKENREKLAFLLEEEQSSSHSPFVDHLPTLPLLSLLLFFSSHSNAQLSYAASMSVLLILNTFMYQCDDYDGFTFRRVCDGCSCGMASGAAEECQTCVCNEEGNRMRYVSLPSERAGIVREERVKRCPCKSTESNPMSHANNSMKSYDHQRTSPSSSSSSSSCSSCDVSPLSSSLSLSLPRVREGALANLLCSCVCDCVEEQKRLQVY
ncbi:hypothetical protein ADUPG1_009129, partial [Aduncisulcus paluster]